VSGYLTCTSYTLRAPHFHFSRKAQPFYHIDRHCSRQGVPLVGEEPLPRTPDALTICHNFFDVRSLLSRRKQIIEEYFGTVSGEDDWNPRYDIAPTQSVPVIRQNPKEPRRELSLMKWGRNLGEEPGANLLLASPPRNPPGSSCVGRLNEHLSLPRLWFNHQQSRDRMYAVRASSR
jgi:hypothetical protein